MADRAKPKATETTAGSRVTGKDYFTVEMPGTGGLRSNYRQTKRSKETGGSDGS
jgi:hypothetical protein